MTVGKAIYYLLSNYSDLTDIVSTRIYPEVAEQDAAMPFVIYTVVSNEPSDTQSSPSQLDIAQVDIVLFSTDYSQVVDMGVAARAALDRVTGTYNGVNVQSCQYTSEVIDFEEYPRAYVITQSYDVRINRDEFEIVQGTPVSGANIIDLADTPNEYGTTGQALVVNADGDGMEWGETASDLGDLTNVTLDDPQDREALVYDEDTDTWINGASTKLAIRVINQTGATLYAATPVKASGVQGDQVSVTLYRATEDAKLFIGLLDADIPNGGTGYARQTGTIYHLNTLAFTVGQILYPAQAAAGIDNGLDYMTATVPGKLGHPRGQDSRGDCAAATRQHGPRVRPHVVTGQQTGGAGQRVRAHQERRRHHPLERHAMGVGRLRAAHLGRAIGRSQLQPRNLARQDQHPLGRG
jgi:hypothetical protein